MEFIPSKTAATKPLVKIGWFYRPKDAAVGARKKNYDPRLLFATMHSDINPVSSIRGKCKIEHVHYIKDLEAYKIQDDAFYYNQLYDRYNHRVYDVVPVAQLKNLPSEVAAPLSSYRFILVEAGKASDWTDKRICPICNRWCNPDEPIVKCVTCREAFHLHCVGLAKKPSRGYAWQCAMCLKKEVEAWQDGKDPAGKRRKNGKGMESPKSGTPSLGQKTDIGRRVSNGDMTSIAQPAETEKPLWPFRYFGEYATLADLADPNPDRGHPKACSRIGKQYQADIPELGSRPSDGGSRVGNQYQADIPDLEPTPEGQSSGDQPSTPTEEVPSSARGKKRKRGYKPLERNGDVVEQDVSDRGGPSEVVFCKPDDWTDAQVDDYIEEVLSDLPLSLKSILTVDRALEELHKAKYDANVAIAAMHKLRPADVGIVEWTDEEVKAFEGGVVKYGHELHWVQKEVPTKTMPEVVSYFYKWKKSRRYATVYDQFCKKYRPGKKLKADKGKKITTEHPPSSPEGMSASESEPDDHGPQSPSRSGTLECTNCWTSESPTWKKRQFGYKREIMCQPCAEHWVKYGSARVVGESVKRANRERAASAGKKRKRPEDSTPDSDKKKKKEKKKAKVVGGVKVEEQLLVPEEPPDFDESYPCAVCREFYQYEGNPLVWCSGCWMRVHKDCYGVQSAEVGQKPHQTFRCERCKNIEKPESSLIYKCVLCPTTDAPRETPLKRTVGNNWVHVSCAIWMPEVRFGNVQTLDGVECIGLIDRKRWSQMCTICQTPGGACVTCAERNCNVAFHVSCGLNAGYELTMEVGKGKARNGEVMAVAHCGVHDSRLKNVRRNSTPPSARSDTPTPTTTTIARKIKVEFSDAPPLPTINVTAGATPVDPTLSRTYLIHQHVLTQKVNVKGLKTGGQKRAQSYGLQGTCFCHVGGGTGACGVHNGRRMSAASPVVETFVDLPPVERKECWRCGTGVSPAWWDEGEVFGVVGEGFVGGKGKGATICHECFWGLRDAVGGGGAGEGGESESGSGSGGSV
ncbi:putative PHD type zinc finger protein with BAH domain-containing protein [Rhizophlyctis rosea]|nr:putative PHD type zinc finger protein with BAH domain-containing protein [Rhizophlyctis rosea]